MAVTSDVDNRSSSYVRFWRLLHWGPCIAIGLVVWITFFAIYCDLMYWPPTTPGGCLNLVVFVTWVVLILYHHYRASSIGPGYVPLGWTPDTAAAKACLQYCSFCNGYKAPRSHHCRKCNRCVMKMDHHCPWINACCGHFNHANFTYFLFFAPIGCMHGFVIIVISLYYGLNYRWYQFYGTGLEPKVTFELWSLLGSLFAAGLAVGVTLAVGMLFIVQASTILANETGIESWIKKKAVYRRPEDDSEDEDGGGSKAFIYPYDLGKLRNMQQVFGLCGAPISDGIVWSVRQGCDQYTLTTEQLRQKEDKRVRSVVCNVVQSYGGSLLPISKGLCVCCCVPWTDDTRLKLKIGDTIAVTRWRKYWVYAEKLGHATDAAGAVQEKGWLPRKCIAELGKKKVS